MILIIVRNISSIWLSCRYDEVVALINNPLTIDNPFPQIEPFGFGFCGGYGTDDGGQNDLFPKILTNFLWRQCATVEHKIWHERIGGPRTNGFHSLGSVRVPQSISLHALQTGSGKLAQSGLRQWSGRGERWSVVAVLIEPLGPTFGGFIRPLGLNYIQHMTED